MTRSEIAKVYRTAAKVIGAMDKRSQWTIPAGMSAWTSPSYSLEQAAIWDGYSGAASVLHLIADEFERTDSAEVA